MTCAEDKGDAEDKGNKGDATLIKKQRVASPFISSTSACARTWQLLP